MLTKDELTALFDRLGLSREARRVVQTIRALEPSRRAGSSARSKAYRYASRKMGRVIQAEATQTELAAVITWEHAPHALEFWDQPLRMIAPSNTRAGRRRGFLGTADYLLIETDWIGYVECKPEAWLAAGQHGYTGRDDGSWSHPAYEAAAAELGLGFKVRSSSENCWPLIRNLDFLGDYFLRSAPEPSSVCRKRIFEALDEHGRLTVQQIADLGDGMADALYAMVVRLDVHVDLHKHVLAEPERAYVYRSPESEQVFEQHAASLQPQSEAEKFSVRRGAWVLWDGQPWHILNLGETTLTLANGQLLEELPLAAFNARLGRDIRGLDTKEQADARVFLEILRHASPADLADAHNKYRSLHPRPGDPPCPYSTRAVRSWRQRYDAFERQHGCGFFGLVHHKHRRGNRDRKLDTAVIRIMKSVLTRRYLTAKREPFSTCLKEVRERCKAKGLARPSAKALRFQIRQMARIVEVVEAREGAKAAYQVRDWYETLEPSTPRHGERPFEQGHVDHTVLSLQFVGERFRDLLGKVHLTLLIDSFTRMILAFYLSFDPPSWKSGLCVLRECVRRHQRVPRRLVVDAGSDFQSEYFEQLLARLHCDKVERPKGDARAGSLIERTFGVSEAELINSLAGNNQALKNPRSTSASHDPRLHAVWTLPAFTEKFEQYCAHRNARHHHDALNMTSDEAMAEGARLFGRRPHAYIGYDDSFILLTLPTETGLIVRPGRGVTVNYLTYRCAELKDSRVEGTEVDVKYDPFDVSIAYFWLRPLDTHSGRWVRMYSEYATFFKGRTLKEIQIASAEIKGRKRLKGQRVDVNGEALVEFLSSVEGKEAVLRQRRRDAEAASVVDSPRKSKPAFVSPRGKAGRVPKQPNPWAEPYKPNWRTQNAKATRIKQAVSR